MKKIVLLLPLLLLASVTGCNGDDSYQKLALTFGSYYESKTRDIDRNTIEPMLTTESFLLAIRPSDTSCSCWTNFLHILDNYVASTNYLIYTTSFATIEYSTKMQDFGFPYTGNKPFFFMVGTDKIYKTYEYNSENKFFKDQLVFEEEISKRTVSPKMLYINDENIPVINAKPNADIYYMASNCQDCTYLTPHYLLPYFQNTYTYSNLYVYDCAPLRAEGKEAEWQKFKDDHFLSNAKNEDFGYETGYVPTIQHWQNNILKDAAVFVNDTLVANPDTGIVYISKSFYSGERYSKLTHAQYIEGAPVLETRSLTSNQYYEYQTPSGKIYVWNYDEALKLYKPFLDSYFHIYFETVRE